MLDNYESECCGAEAVAQGGEADLEGPVTMHAVCTSCKQVCNLRPRDPSKPRDLKINVKDSVGIVDKGPGQL